VIGKEGAIFMSALETVETFISALQGNDLELAAGKMSESFLLKGWAVRDIRKNELLVIQSELHAGLSDFSYNLTDQREEGEQVKGLIEISGTHTQELNLPLFGLNNVPATGIAIQLPLVPVFFECEGEQVSLMQIKAVPGGSMAGLIQQLGTELSPELKNDDDDE
jgi:hypothetical protein